MGPAMKRFLWVGMLAWSAAAQGKGDLVVGKIERQADGLVIVYQNQGPGPLAGKEVSLRILRKGRELLTIDHQPLPTEPLQICQSQTIPFEDLKMKPRDFFDLDVEIDPRDEISEGKEQNNSYFQQNNYGSIEEFPNFRSYAGTPRLVIQDVRFAAPNQLEVFVKNEGQGMTMATYGCRLTIRGVSNNLVRRQTQPVPGQTERWTFRFEKWGVHQGERHKVLVEVDPDGWTLEHDRSRARFEEVMAFGPPVPKEVAVGTASGRIQADGADWQPQSCYATWIPGENQVQFLLFPFDLKPQDNLGLTYADPARVCKGRGPEARFAQLKLDLWPGRTRLSRDNIRSAYWHVGKGDGSHSLPCDLDKLILTPVDLKEGVTVKVQSSGSDSREQLSAEFQASLQKFPDVAVAKSEPHRVPHQVPASQVKGTVLFRGKRMAPKSAIGLFRRKTHSLDLWVFPHPLHSEDMTMLKVGWITDMTKYEQKGKVASFNATWDTLQPKPASLSVSSSLDQVGGSATLEKASGHVMELNAPKLGDGLPFGFRIRGKANGLDADLTGTAIMLEVP